jgi:hypothetical protein
VKPGEYVPCPHCGRRFVLREDGTVWSHRVNGYHSAVCPGVNRTVPGVQPTVRIDLHGTGVERTGVWCDKCALPSAVIAKGVLSDSGTLRPVGHFRVGYCTDCGTTWPEQS